MSETLNIEPTLEGYRRIMDRLHANIVNGVRPSEAEAVRRQLDCIVQIARYLGACERRGNA